MALRAVNRLARRHFLISSNKGSMTRAAPYFAPLLNVLFPRADCEHLKIYHLAARKLCHFFGYATLALLASIVFYHSSLVLAAQFLHATLSRWF